MKILAIDTSTSVGSVALLVDGQLVAEIAASVRARHGETLLPHVQRVLELGGLAPAGVDLIAVGLGPGSFTGLRVGLAAVKGLAIANGTPVVGVGSLAAIARGLAPAGGVAVVLADAQRGEVFLAAYDVRETEPATELLAPIHLLPDQAIAHLGGALPEGVPLVFGGTASHAHRAVLATAFGSRARFAPAALDFPRAAHLALEAAALHAKHGPSNAAELEPLYVRGADAKLPDKPLRTP